MNQWTNHVTSRGQDVIQPAVYSENEAWQDFRQSLKGLSTQEKLIRLQMWLNTNGISSGYSREVVQIQVDNYILALRRGGQLDKDYKVVK